MSGERWKIENGDVVELIPGHYYFRYTALRNENSPKSRNKRPLIGESNTSKEQAHSRKKTKEVLGEASLVYSKVCAFGFPSLRASGPNFGFIKPKQSLSFAFEKIRYSIFFLIVDLDCFWFI